MLFLNIIDLLADKELDQVKSFKLLLPETHLVGKVLDIIKKDIKLNKVQGLYLFVKKTQINVGQDMASIYSKYRSEDGFLYIYYTNLASFGNC